MSDILSITTTILRGLAALVCLLFMMLLLFIIVVMFQWAHNPASYHPSNAPPKWDDVPMILVVLVPGVITYWRWLKQLTENWF